MYVCVMQTRLSMNLLDFTCNLIFMSSATQFNQHKLNSYVLSTNVKICFSAL
jgi:hypothetical protein